MSMRPECAGAPSAALHLVTAGPRFLAVLPCGEIDITGAESEGLL